MIKCNSKIVILSCIIILTMIFSINTAFAGDITIPVPAQTQNPYKYLCWATSASMVISYYFADNVNRSVDIAKAKYGVNFDRAADITDTRTAIYNYTAILGSCMGRSLTYPEVQSQINNLEPIVSKLHWTAGGYHEEVIKGYNTSNNYVLYYDPLDDKCQGHGATYSFYNSNSSWTWVDSLTFN